MTQEELDRNFEEEMKPIYAAKERLSAKLNAMTDEEQLAYYDKRGEELIREAHLEKYSQRFNYKEPE
jgi:aspartate/methionine/tyrosine aminotransferase